MTVEQIKLAREVTEKLDDLQVMTGELIMYAADPKKLEVNRDNVEKKIDEMDKILDRVITIFTENHNLMTPSWMPFLKNSGEIIGTVRGIMIAM